MAGKNIVRVRVTIRGTRPLLQHEFGPDAIPLPGEEREKEGSAGNDPSEWKRTCMVTPEGQLCVRNRNVFACLRNAAKHTKKGRGSIQSLVAATLQVEDEVILVNRHMPETGDPPRDPRAPVYVDVCGVKNPSTKARNVRYRLAASAGWEISFTIAFDKTIVSRSQMEAVVNDAGTLEGICDGRSVGNGRFELVAFEELTNAEEAAPAGGVAEPAADRVGKGRKKVREVPEPTLLDGVPH